MTEFCYSNFEQLNDSIKHLNPDWEVSNQDMLDLSVSLLLDGQPLFVRPSSLENIQDKWVKLAPERKMTHEESNTHMKILYDAVVKEVKNNASLKDNDAKDYYYTSIMINCAYSHSPAVRRSANHYLMKLDLGKCIDAIGLDAVAIMARMHAHPDEQPNDPFEVPHGIRAIVTKFLTEETVNKYRNALPKEEFLIANQYISVCNLIISTVKAKEEFVKQHGEFIQSAMKVKGNLEKYKEIMLSVNNKEKELNALPGLFIPKLDKLRKEFENKLKIDPISEEYLRGSVHKDYPMEKTPLQELLEREAKPNPKSHWLRRDEVKVRLGDIIASERYETTDRNDVLDVKFTPETLLSLRRKPYQEKRFLYRGPMTFEDSKINSKNSIKLLLNNGDFLAKFDDKTTYILDLHNKTTNKTFHVITRGNAATVIDPFPSFASSVEDDKKKLDEYSVEIATELEHLGYRHIDIMNFASSEYQSESKSGIWYTRWDFNVIQQNGKGSIPLYSNDLSGPTESLKPLLPVGSGLLGLAIWDWSRKEVSEDDWPTERRDCFGNTIGLTSDLTAFLNEWCRRTPGERMDAFQRVFDECGLTDERPHTVTD